MRDAELPTETSDEVGDDRAVTRGFLWSVAALACLAVVVTAAIVLRPEPVVPTASDLPVAPPAREVAPAVTGVAFRDVAAAAGVDFVHESGARGGKLLPECLAGGVAIVDLDDDGRLDLVFTQGEPLEPADGDPAAGAGGVRIYRNRTAPGAPMRFERVGAPGAVRFR